MQTILVQGRRLGKIMILASAVVIALGIGIVALRAYTHQGRLLGFGNFLYMGEELNLPTWFSSSSLLLCSGLAWVIAAAEPPRARFRMQWRAIALIFLYMSADEGGAIHERLGTAFYHIFGTSFFQNYGWLGPGACVVMLTAMVFLPFVLQLPRKARRLFILGGVIYAAGASGMEAVSLGWSVRNSPGEIGYPILVTIEEAMEICGIVVILHAMLSYASHRAHIDSTK